MHAVTGAAAGQVTIILMVLLEVTITHAAAGAAAARLDAEWAKVLLDINSETDPHICQVSCSLHTGGGGVNMPGAFAKGKGGQPARHISQKGWVAAGSH
jgi:hypothetical protein